MMRLASVLTPLDDRNLTLAAQCGVEEIVVRYPGPDPEALRRLRLRVESFGLRIGAVEGYLPMDRLRLGLPGADQDFEAMCALLAQMGRERIPLLAYHFMASTDWARTRTDVRTRGGALVTEFDVAEADRAVVLAGSRLAGSRAIGADELWHNLDRFLRAMLPHAERNGVALAMHPDDPPLLQFRGNACIMASADAFRRLMALHPSASNGICFCQGTFAAMGADVIGLIRELGPHIRYVHFRDARGTREHFVETFHDDGPTDMAAAMRAYRSVGFNGPMRPDHVPQLAGEENGEPGYTMLGRLFAYGYIRGLIQATR